MTTKLGTTFQPMAATQSIKACRHGPDDLLNFESSNRMEKVTQRNLNVAWLLVPDRLI